MDQEDTMDFRALRARFQDEELLLKQPKMKPALPERPKAVPPPTSPTSPTSPTHHLPAGARPSLLTSISQTLDGNSTYAPRVIFKDKKETKKPLFNTISKSKEKSEGKQKSSKERNLLTLGSSKEPSGELVAATPPPKVQAPKKKGFMSFGRSLKKNPSVNVISDPILDTPSAEMEGVIPLIPVPSDFGDSEPELSPNSPTSPYSDAAIDTPHFDIPARPDFLPPPAFIPDIPTPRIQTLERGSPPPVMPVYRQDEGLPTVTPPSPLTDTAALVAELKPPSLTNPLSLPSSPNPERPISALSALERAEDMTPVKKVSPADQRILNALEKARRKINNSAQTTPTSSSTVSPLPEEISSDPVGPTDAALSLPPIDYEDRFGLSSKPGQVNGLDHLSGGVYDEGSGIPPMPLEVPPSPPPKVLSAAESLGPVGEKPTRPPSSGLFNFASPLLNGDKGVHVPGELSGTTDIPDFDRVASVAHSPELPESDWDRRRSTGPVDGPNGADYYTNGVADYAAGVEDGYQDTTQINLPGILSESPDHNAVAELQTNNGIYDATDNAYEDINTMSNKKKGKADAGKKRKGPPKNPYAEAQEANEEKSKSGRFGKNDKKAAAEGPDEKELKKKEKQRLEKEKKEQKERQEREKKEQKEREKRENELKKKFNITGQEDAIYKATVTVTTKGRKTDLPVNNGDVVSIIRTTNCPRGKWLARDESNNYGYIAVDHVELDIKEMMELGKKAAVSRKISNNMVDGETASVGSRDSNHYPLSTESFSDDSEEWACDDDEPASPAAEPEDPLSLAGHTRTLSMPDMGNKELSVIHQHSQSDISADGSLVKARHEALQKLATFFHAPKPASTTVSPAEAMRGAALVTEEAAPAPVMSSSQVDMENLLILPPPDLYADFPAQ